MKLAEALLQDRPIKKKGMPYFYEPRVVNAGSYLRVSLKSIRHELDYHLLTSTDFDSDDWEVKQEPMKFEFECRWEAERSRGVYPVGEMEELNKVVNSGKKFKVTCEEIVE